MPLLEDPQNGTQVLLITSRETKRWVIPKGWPMKGKKDYKAAEREAFEEAGLIGRAGKNSIGSYFYWKRGVAAFGLCEVTVYPFYVARQATTWREKGQRQMRWFPVDAAALLVDEPGLQDIIEKLSLKPRPSSHPEASGEPIPPGSH